ncbi:MAG: uroporphyrinogen decarboxylase family protein [Anaerolineae bacterium]|nr:uroporphyrinogen decarboxylase family protein [Anaerolineae bacterium]
MTTPRDRIVNALSLLPTDRVPRDLGGMRSTGISAFAYPRLVEALGLPPRPTRVEDTGQMLAVPDLDVLDALGCDAVAIYDGVTNAFDQPELWHDYDFSGRLAAQVRNPQAFHAQPDGTIVQDRRRMVPGSYVFDEAHGGQPLDLSADLPRPDLDQVRRAIAARELRDDQIMQKAQLCRRVRESTDRAIFLNDGSLGVPLGIGAFSGLAIFPMLCVLEPNFVAELHELLTEAALRNIRALLPEIRDNVDVIMMAADDWGTQANLIASPKVYRTLFLPYHQRINAAVHEIAPTVKRFLHSCGAIYDLIDLVIDSGYDALNPVQWSAGGHSFREWKDRARGRIALWGGGVNSQVTLPLGTVSDVEAEVRDVVRCMREDSGFVFCNIHNILAEVTPDKVIAMYRVAGEPLGA